MHVTAAESAFTVQFEICPWQYWEELVILHSQENSSFVALHFPVAWSWVSRTFHQHGRGSCLQDGMVTLPSAGPLPAGSDWKASLAWTACLPNGNLSHSLSLGPFPSGTDVLLSLTGCVFPPRHWAAATAHCHHPKLVSRSSQPLLIRP